MRKPSKLVLVPYPNVKKKIGDMVLFHGNDHKDHLIVVDDEYTANLYWELQSGKVVKPYVVCDDAPVDGDMVLTDGYGIWDFKESPCPMPYWGNSRVCKKIIAFPDQVGLLYVKGKLGTHGLNDFYTTEITTQQIEDVVTMRLGKCEIEMEEVRYVDKFQYKIKIKDGKIILHL